MSNGGLIGVSNVPTLTSASGVWRHEEVMESIKNATWSKSYVTDGLMTHWEAGNTASWPGSGTTWYDLSGNGTNATFNSAPTLSSNSFDMSANWADFNLPSISSGVMSIEMVAKVNAWGGMFCGWNIYDVWTSSGHIGYNTGNSDLFGVNSSTVTSLGCLSNIKHYIFEWRSDISYTSNRVFIQGISQTMGQQLSSESATYRNFNGGSGRISGWRYTTGYPLNMNLYMVRIYNRGLSYVEALQNYNSCTRLGV